MDNLFGKTVAVILLIVVVLAVIGTYQASQKPIPQWQVELVSPENKVVDTWIVSSRGYPQTVVRWGGQTELRANNISGSYTVSGVYAPACWFLRIEKYRRENKKI